MPDGFAWPRRPYQWVPGGSSERPLTFLGQVDCTALPQADGRDLLPRDGALLFFVHWDLLEGEEGEHVTQGLVQHVPGRPDAWREVEPPADLPACYAGQADYHYRWLKHTDLTTRRYPSSFPKWAMEPRPLAGISRERSDELEAERPILYPQGLSREQARVLQAAYGDAVEDNQLLNHYNRDREGVWRPFAGFPHAWIAVEMAAGLLLHPEQGFPPEAVGRRPTAAGAKAADDFAAQLTGAMAEALRRHGIDPATLPPKRQPSPAEAEEKAQGYREARADAARWVERARRGGLHQGVPEGEKAAFWAWLDGLHAAAGGRAGDRRSAYYLNKCLGEAAVLSIDLCLAHSAAAAALVPTEARDAVLQRHAALVRGHPQTAGRHQMLGAGLDVQNAPEEFGGTHVLLMQFDTDYGLGWMFGDCGVLQYWIAPGDLAAGRFDRAFVTLDSH